MAMTPLCSPFRKFKLRDVEHVNTCSAFAFCDSPIAEQKQTWEHLEQPELTDAIALARLHRTGASGVTRGFEGLVSEGG